MPTSNPTTTCCDFRASANFSTISAEQPTAEHGRVTPYHRRNDQRDPRGELMAGGKAGATIITQVAKDLLGDAAKDVERDVAKDAAESPPRTWARTLPNAPAQKARRTRPKRPARVRASARAATRSIWRPVRCCSPRQMS